jgi:hypothetical protein
LGILTHNTLQKPQSFCCETMTTGSPTRFGVSRNELDGG